MDDFKKCLFEDVEQYREMSFKHELYTVSINKLALSNKDDKRKICENRIDTLPWGYDGKKFRDSYDKVLQMIEESQFYLKDKKKLINGNNNYTKRNIKQ